MNSTNTVIAPLVSVWQTSTASNTLVLQQLVLQPVRVHGQMYEEASRV